MAELDSKQTFCHRVDKMYVFEHDFDGSPNPRVDIYPQMGSEHNINLIFVRFSASRVGFKKHEETISRKPIFRAGEKIQISQGWAG